MSAELNLCLECGKPSWRETLIQIAADIEREMRARNRGSIMALTPVRQVAEMDYENGLRFRCGPPRERREGECQC